MASGDSLFDLKPQNRLPTNTVSATLGTLNDGSTVVGVIPYLGFAGDTADTHAEWLVRVPSHYAGGGFTFIIDYAMDGTVGTAVQFEVRALDIPASTALGSLNVQAQTATDITDTPNGTANTTDTTPSGAISHANAGSPAAGSLVKIRISRDYDHAANTDLVQFLGCHVTET